MKTEGLSIAELKRELDDCRQRCRELEASQEDLRRFLTKHQEFFSNITDACMEFDLQGHCTFCNEAAHRNAGYTREGYMAMGHRERYASAEDAAKIFQMFHETYRTGLPGGLFTAEMLSKDGTIRTVEMSVSLIRNDAGQPAGFRCVARNVTDRKRMAGVPGTSMMLDKRMCSGDIDLKGMDQTLGVPQKFPREEGHGR